jgi:glycosyltransferase involved in cell wall biosynthesis
VKILILSSYAPSLVLFRGALISTFVAAGHNVIAVAPNIDDSVSNQLRLLGAQPLDLPLKRTGMNPLYDLLYCWRLYKTIRKCQPNLVLTYTAKPNIWGAIAAKAAGVRSVSMITGLGFAFTNDEAGDWRRALTLRIQTFLYRKSTSLNTIVLFHNADDRDDFVRSGCFIDPTKSRIVNGSGVDLDYYAPTPVKREPHFLMIARLLKSKGVREYAEAAIQIKAQYPDAVFTLVGFFDEGPDGIAPATVAAWQVQGLEYAGYLEDVRPALAAATVYVLPSYREGTPRSVLEAMASGRAILTTDVAGCRETVVDGFNGLLVPAKDSRALADKMRWMIENHEAVVTMGGNSLRIAREKYDVQKVNAKLISHLNAALSDDFRAGTKGPDPLKPSSI